MWARARWDGTSAKRPISTDDAFVSDVGVYGICSNARSLWRVGARSRPKRGSTKATFAAVRGASANGYGLDVSSRPVADGHPSAKRLVRATVLEPDVAAWTKFDFDVSGPDSGSLTEARHIVHAKDFGSYWLEVKSPLRLSTMRAFSMKHATM